MAEVSELPAARYASTSSVMRPRSETVTPLAAAHARTAAIPTPSTDDLPVAQRPCGDPGAAVFSVLRN